MLRPVDVDTSAPQLAVCRSHASADHQRTQVGSADPDVHHVGDAPTVCPSHSPLRTRPTKRPIWRAAIDVRHDSTPSTAIGRHCGCAGRVQHAALLRVVMASPRNRRPIQPGTWRPGASASSSETVCRSKSRMLQNGVEPRLQRQPDGTIGRRRTGRAGSGRRGRGGEPRAPCHSKEGKR